MRRGSILRSQNSEPLIVVEDEKEEEKTNSSSRQSSEDESTTLNPFLLSPYAREIRKHSLPTPQCSGITASQVRRLSERGETTGPSPRQVEFLATLSQVPQQSAGGRRHSVVTISKLPSPLFGRNRRESVAAFPTLGFSGRILPNRRESIACPPSTDSRGSVHNLQLDIMDDIVQARKVRMKMWNTSKEKVCEVQPLDETGTVQRYTNSVARRFSDFVGTTLAPIPSMSKRRASDLPQPSTSGVKKPSSGIVCTNTDLISILHSLSTSATEINQCEKEQEDKDKPSTSRRRGQLKNSRSNSFDISILQEKLGSMETISIPTATNWFTKRHQPTKTDIIKKAVSNQKEKKPGKVMWDEKSGSLVDPQALGSAIEVFLRKTSPSDSSSVTTSPTKTLSKILGKGAAPGRSKTWFSKEDDETTESCDSSICSTLKDLFVK
ncbi:unnamed protein product [Callosobruchus maculatus]|uniref:Uncharacterized protein n=1 Tax=Callosobruchus maculatus TaxID=64391 RepID=A0A653CSQ4_CALMS|nr:unnamed protein product [Callosobruchus maculatus]